MIIPKICNRFGVRDWNILWTTPKCLEGCLTDLLIGVIGIRKLLAVSTRPFTPRSIHAVAVSAMLGKLWKATPSNGLWGDSPTAESSSSIVQDGPEAHKLPLSKKRRRKMVGRSSKIHFSKKKWGHVYLWMQLLFGLFVAALFILQLSFSVGGMDKHLLRRRSLLEEDVRKRVSQYGSLFQIHS